MAKYDPNTKYGWDNETPFTLNGQEFGLILNTFRTVLTSPEAQKILLMNQANNAIEGVLQRNVESGLIKETPEGTGDVPLPSMKVVDPEVVDPEVVEPKTKRGRPRKIKK